MTSGFIALPRGSTRWVAAGAICAGYAVLAHLAAADPNPNQLDVGVATVPPVAVSLLLAWRSSQRVLMLLLCLAGTVGLYAAAGWLVGYYNWVFLLQHVGMQVLLGLAFGHTLRASRTPLVSRIAALVHGPLSPTLYPPGHMGLDAVFQRHGSRLSAAVRAGTNRRMVRLCQSSGAAAADPDVCGRVRGAPVCTCAFRADRPTPGDSCVHACPPWRVAAFDVMRPGRPAIEKQARSSTLESIF